MIISFFSLIYQTKRCVQCTDGIQTSSQNQVTAIGDDVPLWILHPSSSVAFVAQILHSARIRDTPYPPIERVVGILHELRLRQNTRRIDATHATDAVVSEEVTWVDICACALAFLLRDGSEHVAEAVAASQAGFREELFGARCMGERWEW